MKDDYGHGKYETLATAIIGIFPAVCGFGFLNGASIYRFPGSSVSCRNPVLALVAALVSIVFKGSALSIYPIHSRKLDWCGGCQCLASPEWMLLSKNRASAAVYRWRHSFGDHWRVLDPVAAVIVSFFIMKVAVQLLIPCIELLEKSLPVEVEDDTEDLLFSLSVSVVSITFVRRIEQLLCHRGTKGSGWQSIRWKGSPRDGNGGGEQVERQFGKETGQHPCVIGEEE